MKKCLLLMGLLSCYAYNLYSVTTLYNATPNPLKITITYATPCLSKDSDISLLSDQNISEFVTNLPANARVDVSGTSGQQKRTDPWCYKDIMSIKAAITFHDDDKNVDTEVARTWYRDQINQRPNWVIRYSSQQLLTLQAQ